MNEREARPEPFRQMTPALLWAVLLVAGLLFLTSNAAIRAQQATVPDPWGETFGRRAVYPICTAQNLRLSAVQGRDGGAFTINSLGACQARGVIMTLNNAYVCAVGSVTPHPTGQTVYKSNCVSREGTRYDPARMQLSSCILSVSKPLWTGRC